MRHDPLEISYVNKKPRTRRVWYGHGSSRLIADDDRNPPPATAIDEAMAGYERDDAAKPQSHAIIADLSAQLAILDRQRDRLARLLREITA